MPSLQPVVMVARGYGADTVLFACGHTCLTSPHRGRGAYPGRRRCSRCLRGEAPTAVDRAKFGITHRDPETLIPEEV